MRLLILFFLFFVAGIADSFAQNENKSSRNANSGHKYRTLAGQSVQDQQVQEAAVQFFSKIDSSDNGIKFNAHVALINASIGDIEQSKRIAFEIIKNKNENGEMVFRQFLRIKVYRSSPESPKPGVYVAVDFVSRFENADRSCGYLIFHRVSDSAPYSAIRLEENTLNNSVAKSILTKRSPEELERVWKTLAQKCPGGVPISL